MYAKFRVVDEASHPSLQTSMQMEGTTTGVNSTPETSGRV